MSGRIVGGHDASIDRNRFMLAFEYGGHLICGATIISNHWAVTAAHCFNVHTHKFAMALRAGTDKLQSGGQLFPVEEIVLHDNYTNGGNFDNDIALIRVKTSFRKANNLLLPVQLPDKDYEIPVGTMTRVLGWGYTKEKGSVSEHLQEVDVPIISESACKKVMNKQVTSITNNMLCAGYPEGNKDACQADSGGPMLVNHMLIGLVSFGEGCARLNRPGVYTEVSAYTDWIREKTKL